MSSAAESTTIVTIPEAAKVLGVHRKTIDDWIYHGLPIERKGVRGKPTLLDTTKVLRWYAQREVKLQLGESDAVDINEAKRRKLIAEAGLQELSLMKENGEVIELDLLIKTVVDKILSCKAKLYNMPARVAPRVVGETDEHKILEIFKEELTECLNELDGPYA